MPLITALVLDFLYYFFSHQEQLSLKIIGPIELQGEHYAMNLNSKTISLILKILI